MRLSVVICTYDRYDLLPEALQALVGQSVPPEEFEILVIDNSPDAERSAAEASKHAKIANLSWHHVDRPGLSNARNVGFAAAKGEIVAFLDDDAIAVPGWAAAMLAAFDALGPEVAAVGGKVTPLFRVPRPDWLSDKHLSHLSMVDLGEERRPIAAGEWVVGANLAYRRELLAGTGGFSTNLGRLGSVGLLSAEETEVANKLYSQGHVIAYDPQARVDHIVDASRTTQAWFARRIAWQAVSALLAGETGSAEDIAHAAIEIRRYFAALHPADRHVGALLAELETPGELDWQYGTIYNLILLLLAGGRATPAAEPLETTPPEAASPAPSAERSDAAPEASSGAPSEEPSSEPADASLEAASGAPSEEPSVAQPEAPTPAPAARQSKKSKARAVEPPAEPSDAAPKDPSGAPSDKPSVAKFSKPSAAPSDAKSAAPPAEAADDA